MIITICFPADYNISANKNEIVKEIVNHDNQTQMFDSSVSVIIYGTSLSNSQIISDRGNKYETQNLLSWQGKTKIPDTIIMLQIIHMLNFVKYIIHPLPEIDEKHKQFNKLCYKRYQIAHNIASAQCTTGKLHPILMDLLIGLSPKKINKDTIILKKIEMLIELIRNITCHKGTSQIYTNMEIFISELEHDFEVKSEDDEEEDLFFQVHNVEVPKESELIEAETKINYIRGEIEKIILELCLDNIIERSDSLSEKSRMYIILNDITSDLANELLFNFDNFNKKTSIDTYNVTNIDDMIEKLKTMKATKVAQ